MVEPLLSGIGAVLLLAGCTLATVGLIGLLLKPDLFEQLHVAGLVTGSGVILVLLASVGSGSADSFTSAMLVLAFVLVTGSISTHVIAQAGARRYPRPPGGSRQGIDTPVASPTDVRGPLDPVLRRTDPGHGMRVVVAHDGSPAATVAFDLAQGMDWPDGTVIRLVAASRGELLPLDAPVTPEPAADAPADERTDSMTRADLDGLARALDREGIRVETAVLHGDTADALVDDIAVFGADLLVTGARRRGRFQTLLGLSAAGDIVDRAPCPVLVARSATLGRVMLTTDGSPHSDAATELLARWPIFDLARIHVTTVSTEPAPVGGRSRAPTAAGEQARIVDAAAARLMDAGRDVVTEVLHGHPATRIVEVAEQRSIDLIVIGSRGRTGLGRSLLGSVAGEVLAAAGCSVLIVAPPVRQPRHEASP